jgi:hypothetical protein
MHSFVCWACPVGAIQPVSATSSLSVHGQLARQRTPDQAARTKPTG